MEPTEAQREIIDYTGNAVVSASPGSGKTFVLAQKIKNILVSDEIREYEGVIAISFTRKAATNLKKRVLGSGFKSKNSTFATISNFCLNQIVLPFAKYIWGFPNKAVEVVELEELTNKDQSLFNWISTHPDYKTLSDQKFKNLAALYVKGYVLVETIEVMALHILKNCKACQNYLKARYKYILIDEFQDADTYINELFLNLVSMGMIGTVVGDERQAIFGFANKSNHYLKALKVRHDFKSFMLNDNFRCSQPIINYSNRLLDPNFQSIGTDKEGMYLVRVDGSEINIAEYIDLELASIKDKWGIVDDCECAILVKNDRTQKVIDAYLKHPHRVVRTTPLDLDINFSSRIYSELLKYKFDYSISLLHIIDQYIEYEDLSHKDKETLWRIGRNIRSQRIDTEDECLHLIECFNQFIKIILPKETILSKSTTLLMNVLNDADSIEAYYPLTKEELPIMTLHKSKGLEFDVVFHLNMNEWELPYVDYVSRQRTNLEQDMYLHYVGITRARKACYMIRNTSRLTNKGSLIPASDSYFLGINDLNKLRIDLNG